VGSTIFWQRRRETLKRDINSALEIAFARVFGIIFGCFTKYGISVRISCVGAVPSARFMHLKPLQN